MVIIYAGLWLLVYLKGKNRTLSNVFNIFTTFMWLWTTALAMFYAINDNKISLNFMKMVYMFGGLIPPSFVLYSYAYIRGISRRDGIKYTLLYLPYVLLAMLYFQTDTMITKVVYSGDVKGWEFGNYHYIWEIFFAGFFTFGFYRYIHIYKHSVGMARVHIKYILFGTLSGVLLASATNVILPFIGVFDYVWLGPVGASTWLICIVYTIIKFQLLEIKIAVTRAGIFICVYTLVLGVPFGIGLKYLGAGLWLMPVSLMAVFATVGPFIYLFIQKRAEEALLAEQRQYQNTLRQASMGMSRIKDINKLLNLMAHILSRTVRIEHCAIYLLDGAKGNYTLKASRGFEVGNKEVLQELDEDSILIKRLKENQEIIVYEEIKQQAADAEDEYLKNIIAVVQKLDAELVVPSLDEDHLIAVIVLGKKKSGEMYSSDDLLVFSILANQSAIGIENALFYEETGKGLVEKFHEKRLKFLGELGSGVAHQMNNRFNVMSMAAGVGLDEIKEKDIQTLPKEELIQIIQYNKEVLEKIENSALKGKEIAEAIKTYSKASVVPSAVTLEQSISSSLNLLACKFKTEYLNVRKEYTPNTFVWANLSTLQEVISNAIDNSHDAMRTKEKLIASGKVNKEKYRPELVIRVNPEDNKLKIEIIDNGIGMKPEELDKVFVPFFTTKGASKGTGMGLNMMKQLLEKNQGTIAIDSKYEEGTTVTLKVPLATEEQINQTQEETDES
jgi:signal transduction histidine kinase